MYGSPQRKDLMPPCGRCQDKVPACSDRCTKPEYIEWKQLMGLKRQDAKARATAAMDDIAACKSRYRQHH